MAEAKEIRLIDVQAAFIVVGAGIALGTIVLLIEKLVNRLSLRFCLKKENTPCKHIKTVRTIEMELDEVEISGMSNGVYSVEDNGTNNHINNGYYSQSSLDGY